MDFYLLITITGVDYVDDPQTFAAKHKVHDPDTPLHYEAMTSEFANEMSIIKQIKHPTTLRPSSMFFGLGSP